MMVPHFIDIYHDVIVVVCLFVFQVFPSTVDQKSMDGESAYNLMFGPDICGPGTKKVHVIFNYKGKNLLIKKDIRCKVRLQYVYG